MAPSGFAGSVFSCSKIMSFLVALRIDLTFQYRIWKEMSLVGFFFLMFCSLGFRLLLFCLLIDDCGRLGAVLVAVMLDLHDVFKNPLTYLTLPRLRRDVLPV